MVQRTTGWSLDSCQHWQRNYENGNAHGKTQWRTQKCGDPINLSVKFSGHRYCETMIKNITLALKLIKTILLKNIISVLNIK